MGLDAVVAGAVCASGSVDDDDVVVMECASDEWSEAVVGSEVFVVGACCAVVGCIGVMLLLLPILAPWGMKPLPPSPCSASLTTAGRAVDTAVAAVAAEAWLCWLAGLEAADAVEGAIDAVADGVSVAESVAAAVVALGERCDVAGVMDAAFGAVVVVAWVVSGGAAVDIVAVSVVDDAVVGVVENDGGRVELVVDVAVVCVEGD